MKIEIKSRFTAEVLFSAELENNSIKLTLQAAIEAKADLYGANLRGANLCGADLRGANLYGADGKELKCDGKYHHITNIGSESGTLELYSCGADGWLIKRGCFTGSKDEFLAAVYETHGDNYHARKYRAIIAALCD